MDDSELRATRLEVAPGGPGDDDDDDEPPIGEPDDDDHDDGDEDDDEEPLWVGSFRSPCVQGLSLARYRVGLKPDPQVSRLLLQCSTATEFLV